MNLRSFISVLFIVLLSACSTKKDSIESRVDDLLSKMTLDEKIGQLNQLNSEGTFSDLEDRIKEGKVGSVLNEVDPVILNKYQRIAIEESRLGIPILFARDIIHGYKTIFPIPLGQAASWNPDLAEKAGRITAIEATSVGIRWTFAPMIDVSRDGRWGRIAESMGEDPYLSGKMGAAMIKGLQGHDLSDPTSLAACAKHFVGYGATEGGRDYNTTIISDEQLRNTYLIPFKAAKDAGCATFMVAFNEINGVPCSGNPFLTKEILRKEWHYDGMVVSDWGSISEMIIHGYCKDTIEAAKKAIDAGIDMDMMSEVYISALNHLIKDGKIKESAVNDAVRNILRLKFRLGLFENPYANINRSTLAFYAKEHLDKAKEIAIQSIVLLKNDNNILPLKNDVKSIAVIGPLADAAHDQMGTWVFDGEKEHTVTPIQSLKAKYGDKIKINYVKTLTHSRDANTSSFAQAVSDARNSDVVLFFAGEESILSGEARCRADISLPGAQKQLLAELKKTGKPIVMIIMAGRPVEIDEELPLADALLYAWHPGTMGGPAITDLLFGKSVPSGKLPITYPKMVGQIPIYYNHKNTGRPPVNPPGINDIPVEAPQMSLGNRSYYLDAGDKPLFPFGYGLSYTTFEYSDLNLSKSEISKTESLTVSCSVTNTGQIEAAEVVQLYIRDMFASITRPVKELKDFKRIKLQPGETKEVSFTLSPEQLSFWNNDNQFLLEPGDFKVWIATNSAEGLEGDFRVN